MKSIHLLSRVKFRKASAVLSLLLCSTVPMEASFKAQGYVTPAYIDFQLPEWTVSEGDRQVEVVVRRTGEFRHVTTVNFETVEGTATEGRDYKGSGGTLVFQPLESMKTITIGLVPDGLDEGDELFSVKLSSADPGAFLIRETASVILKNSLPGPPVLTIKPESGGRIVLSWAASAECVLERASSVNATSWETVLTEPALNGDRYEVRESITKPVFLYRLRQK